MMTQAAQTVPATLPQTRVLQRMNEEHLAIAELVLEGKTPTEIGERMSRSPQAIRILIRQPLFQEHLSRRRTERTKRADDGAAEHLSRAKALIEAAAVEAAEVKIELLNHEKPEIRMRAASDILETAFGLNKDTGSDGKQFNIAVLGHDAMQNLMEALKESGTMGNVATTASALPSVQSAGEPSDAEGVQGAPLMLDGSLIETPANTASVESQTLTQPAV